MPFHRELNPSLGPGGLFQGKTAFGGGGGALWRISGLAASTWNPAAPVCGDSHMDQVMVHSWGDRSASHSTGREGLGMSLLGQDGFWGDPIGSRWIWVILLRQDGFGMEPVGSGWSLLGQDGLVEVVLGHGLDSMILKVSSNLVIQ